MCLACVHVHCVCPVPAEARTGHQIPCRQSYRWVWSTMWVLWTKPRLSKRLLSSLDHWAILPACHHGCFYTKYSVEFSSHLIQNSSYFPVTPDMESGGESDPMPQEKANQRSRMKAFLEFWYNLSPTVNTYMCYCFSSIAVLPQLQQNFIGYR